MSTCSVLISNYNSGEAIQLCIESIRAHDMGRPAEIIVYNDHCTNGIDDAYLRACRDKGWITLYENATGKQMTHGGVLNKLLNEICRTDYAAVLDCDIEITGDGWLNDMAHPVRDDVLGVCDWRQEAINSQGYCSGLYKLWFAFLNMRAYRDGMQVDWRFSYEDARKWPYNQMFGYLTGIPKPDGFDENKVCNDPGSQLYVQVHYRNPNRYRMVPIPQHVKPKYHHFGHISVLSELKPHEESAWARANKEPRLKKIHNDLMRLRCR